MCKPGRGDGSEGVNRKSEGMTENELRRMALCMLADYDARTPGELFSRPVDLTIPESYVLQSEIARLREQRGEKIIGYKIGCTSKAIQQQLGVGEPIFGRIFDTGCFRDRKSVV